MQGEPFGGGQVKRLILACLGPDGTILFDSHAVQEMRNDNISEQEALAVLRGGAFDGRDLIAGTWRYRIRRTKTYVVVAFRAETLTVVVTAWRKK